MIADQYRGVVSLAFSRLAKDAAELVFYDFSDNNDGSFETPKTTVPVKGFFTSLEAREIQRLREGGVTLNAGAYFSLPYELDRVPNEILCRGQNYAIIKPSIAAGTSVFLIDRKPLGVAQVEAGATA